MMQTKMSPSRRRLDLARSRLLEPNDLSLSTLEGALANVSAPGTDFADLYFEATANQEWRLEEGKVIRGGFSIRQGVGVRSVSGEKTAFSYSSEMNPRALFAVTEAARAMQRQGADAARSGGITFGGGDGGALELYPAESADGDADIAAKIALLHDVDRAARAVDPRIVRVTAQLQITDTTVLVAATDGTLGADVRPLVRLALSVVAESNGRRAQGSAGTGGRMMLADLSQAALARLVDRATRTALVNLDAKPAPAGVMTVVLGPGFPGILLHEAVGHGLEGDAHRKRSSVFADYMGAEIAARGVTVVDDATVPGRAGALNIDDEGNPGERTVLIEDGRLVGLMQDRHNARLMNQRTTGNARRQSYAHLPLPRMTNTFLENGAHDPGEILASVKRGIYAVEFGGGTVDITSGQFNFAAVQAYLIEDGKITAPIEGATLIGVGHQALKHVSMVGNDLALDEGEATCGKNGQNVVVGVGQPTVRIDEVVIGGAG